MAWLRNSKVKILIWLILLAILISGCTSLAQEKLWLRSAGWSMGLKLGETGLAGVVPAAVSPAGEVISVLFPRADTEEVLFHPEIVILSREGGIRERIPVDLTISKPGSAQLLLSEDEIRLFWIERFRLYSVRVSLAGNLLSDVQTVSGEERLSQFSVIPIPGGYSILCSGSRDYPGVYLYQGTPDDLRRIEVDPEGMRAEQYLDQGEVYHLSWVRYPFNYGDLEIFYLETSLPDLDLEDKVLIHTEKITPAIRIDGPVLGFDQELAYFFWSRSIVSGLDTGSQRSFLQYFPLGRPDEVRPPFNMYVPGIQLGDEEPFYGGYFQVGERIPLGGDYPRTPYLNNLSVLPGSYPELAIVYRSQAEFKWRDVRSQVNLAYIKNGLVTSYQSLSYTSTDSTFPGILQDQDQNLYVTWLEKERTTFYAFLTTTDPLKRQVLDQVTAEEYFYLTAEGIFGVLAGAILSPFAAAVWGGAGLIAFVFNMVLSQFHKPIFRTIGEYLSMAGGVFIFWWIKFATLPGLDDGYVPFSAWIPRIPQVLEKPLIIGIPILIGLASAWVAWSRTYGRESDSAINFHLIYSGMDALLSCAIYGIMIYGAF